MDRIIPQTCQQKVKVNHKSSNTLYITNGIPQGSILGPVLFLLYIKVHISYHDNKFYQGEEHLLTWEMAGFKDDSLPGGDYSGGLVVGDYF